MEKFNELFENYFRKFETREHYPRSLKGKLSPEFIQAFSAEKKRLEEEEEIPADKINDRLLKALKFH